MLTKKWRRAANPGFLAWRKRQWIGDLANRAKLGVFKCFDQTEMNGPARPQIHPPAY